MALDREDTTPSQVLTAGAYDARTGGMEDDNDDVLLQDTQDLEEEEEDTRNPRDLPMLDHVAESGPSDPLAQRVYTPVTPNRLTTGPRAGQPRRSRSSNEEDEAEDTEDSPLEVPPDPAGSQSRTPVRTPGKRARLSAGAASDKRDSMLASIMESKSGKNEARIKREEEKTKREELKTQRALAQVEWEKEKLEREERWKREEAERQERIRREAMEREEQRRREDKQSTIELALQIVKALQSQSQGSSQPGPSM